MITVVHNPLGQEHPYEQLPEERFPRVPLAGQPFTVGIVTRPPGEVKQVRVLSKIGDTQVVALSATHIENWRPELEEGVGAEFLDRIVRIEQDVWQTELIAPPVGTTLHYWIEANGVTSEEFSLPALSWRVGGGFQQDDDGNMLISQEITERDQSDSRLTKIEWLHDGERARRVRLTFKCAQDERFYGTGERFNMLNQRGQILDVRCYEQYKNHGKRTYMPIPFLLSSAGFGVWVQSSRWMQFDLAATNDTQWTLEADLGDDETLQLRWFYNDDPYAITGEFAQLTGPVKLPPKWSFGLWMSGNEWNTQAKIEQEVKASLEHRIQPSVVVIEAWSDETTFYIWNDAEYTPVSGDEVLHYADFTFPEGGKWQDPKAMVDWLHDNDIKILLWQIPVLKQAEHAHPQHDADRAHYEQAGFGVREADGSLHKVRPFWFRGGYIWDVTNEAEKAWWLGKRAYLLDEIGIDGFKTDGGEHLWGESVLFADGRTGAEVWNEYPQLYSEAYYQFANQNREAITFSRAGFIGSQRAPLHWAGDENSTWEAYQHSILAGLSAGISGIPFWGWDIAGFSGDLPDAELYLRASAMAAFCPVMQYHSEFNAHRTPSHDRTPWNIREQTGNEDVISIFRHFLNVREQLMDYIWQEAQFSAESGQPMMSAVHIIDENASQYDYFFGRDLFISPIVQAGITRWTVYLPAGEWRSLWSSEIYSGGQHIEIDAPLDRIPVFVRAGSTIPVISADV
ncbi:MAG: glycoside hydrolase family 31 protein [Aggregatilineales bacterium]